MINIPQEDRLGVLIEYDKYIQNANNEDKYSNGWFPVCIQEFYEIDYPELIKEAN